MYAVVVAAGASRTGRGAGSDAVGALVVVDGQADLLQVVLALHAGGGLADLLDGGQEQADQDRDDRDHHQQLDQREPGSALGSDGSRMHGHPPYGEGNETATAHGRHRRSVSKRGVCGNGVGRVSNRSAHASPRGDARYGARKIPENATKLTRRTAARGSYRHPVRPRRPPCPIPFPLPSSRDCPAGRRTATRAPTAACWSSPAAAAWRGPPCWPARRPARRGRAGQVAVPGRGPADRRGRRTRAT